MNSPGTAARVVSRSCYSVPGEAVEYARDIAAAGTAEFGNQYLAYAAGIVGEPARPSMRSVSIRCAAAGLPGQPGAQMVARSFESVIEISVFWITLMFVGRAQELARLRTEFATNRPSLLVVYGRRRIGKSTLLREAAKDSPHVLYQATRVTAALNLEALKSEIARSLGGNDLLNGLGDWLGVLTYLAERAREMTGLVVVLDEFRYLVEVDPSLPSVLQKFWGSGSAATGPLNLVLCGSLIAQMEGLLAERNPLYGRQTLAMDVQALPLRDAAVFFPGYSPEERILTYGIFGGIPFYLRLSNPEAGVKENIIDQLLTDSGPLVDEPNVLLQSELRETQRYASILAAIADGCTKVGEINGRIRDIKDSVSLSPLHGSAGTDAAGSGGAFAGRRAEIA